MRELSKDKYGILLEPVKHVPFNMLMARSVIEGHADGRIFVETLRMPYYHIPI